MNKRFILCWVLLAMALTAGALDLSLKECKQMALDSDESLQIARNKLSQAKLDRGIARASYFPKIDASASALYLTPDSKMGDAMTLQMRGTYLAGFSLTQPIFVGGKIITANRLARVGENAVGVQLKATEMDVIAEAEKSYWMYVAVLSKIDMIKSYMVQLDSIYNYTESAFELGLTTALSLTRVESRRAEVNYRLHQAESGAELCRLALCRIIGVNDTVSILPTERFDTMLEPELNFEGIGARPELELSKINIEAKKLDVKMTLSDYLPTLGLQLGWNAFGNLKMKSFVQLEDGSVFPYTQNSEYRGFMGALSLSVPIFHWGEGYRKVKKSKIEVQNAELALERNRKLIELEARQNYSNYINGFELIESARVAFREAEENLRLMNDRYENGLMTLTDLLDAQAQWHTSYSNLIEAQTQHRINRTDYLRSVGLIEP